MSRVVHFEINADNAKRAAEFYEKVFGWKLQKWEGPVDYWLAITGEKEQPGIDGAIMPRMKKATTTIFMDVPSVDDYLKKVVKAGGKKLSDKETIPGVGYSAYCEDTEGNLIGLFQSDPKAK